MPRRSKHDGPLATAPGPSPWYLFPFAAGDGSAFTWRSAGDTEPAIGKSCLVDQAGRDLLLLEFYCWVRAVGSSQLLVWHQTKREAIERRERASVHIHVFDVHELQPIADTGRACQELDASVESVMWAGGHGACVELSPFLAPGTHRFDVPASIKDAPELFMLVDAARPPDSPRIHLWIVRPASGALEVLPQDWFNQGEFDFGYQWITRVARDPRTGGLVGEGIRLGPFALDDSGTQLKGWLKANPFE